MRRSETPRRKRWSEMLLGTNNEGRDLTLHITVGELLRSRSSSLTFTHVLRSSVSLKPSNAIKVLFFKLKEDLGENETARVLKVIRGVKEQFPASEELSFGENFSHDRAKWYTIASIAVLPGPTDLDALDSPSTTDQSTIDPFTGKLETLMMEMEVDEA